MYVHFFNDIRFDKNRFVLKIHQFFSNIYLVTHFKKQSIISVYNIFNFENHNVLFKFKFFNLRNHVHSNSTSAMTDWASTSYGIPFAFK